MVPLTSAPTLSLRSAPAPVLWGFFFYYPFPTLINFSSLNSLSPNCFSHLFLLHITLPPPPHLILPPPLSWFFFPPSLLFPSSFHGTCSTCQTSSAASSSRPTSNQIISLFHSQGYNKVIMHGLCGAPTNTFTHIHAHPPPLVLMEVDVAFPLKNSVDVLCQRELATWCSPD